MKTLNFEGSKNFFYSHDLNKILIIHIKLKMKNGMLQKTKF